MGVKTTGEVFMMGRCDYCGRWVDVYHDGDMCYPNEVITCASPGCMAVYRTMDDRSRRPSPSDNLTGGGT